MTRRTAAILLLAILSGCLWFLSCIHLGLSLLAWIAGVPLFFALDRARTVKSAVLIGWLTGTVVNIGGFYWIALVLHRFADLPWWLAVPVMILFCTYQGINFLLFAWVVRFVRERTRLPMVLLAPLAMVPCEFFLPSLFPHPVWISQAFAPHVIQIADLTGAVGVTALLLAVSGAIYDLLTLRRRGIVPAFAGALLLLGALGYGSARRSQVAREIAAAPKLPVGIVQPNVGFDSKGLRLPGMAQQELAALQEQTRELAAQGAQLVVWSETSYPYLLPQNFASDFPASSPFAVRRGSTVPVVFGAETRSPAEPGPRNSAFLLDANGKIAGRYDKVLLLAFGESLPAPRYLSWVRRWIPSGYGIVVPGSEVRLLPFQDGNGRIWQLGANICYEDILRQSTRRIGGLHPQLVLNLTNDTWFGAGSEPWEHLELAVFGAVEQRVGIVRAVNSGVSAFIDPDGSLIRTTDAVDPIAHPATAQSALQQMPLLEGGHTVYEKLGDFFPYLCLAATALLIGLALAKGPSRARVESLRKP